MLMGQSYHIGKRLVLRKTKRPRAKTASATGWGKVPQKVAREGFEPTTKGL